MTNLKAAKLQARHLTDVAADLILNKTVKTGPFGLLEENLDWNGKMTCLTTLLWDVCSAYKANFEWFAENAQSYKQTEDAEGAAGAVQSGIEMIQYVIEDVVDDFYANTNELSITEEVFDAVEVDSLEDRFAVYGELCVSIAKLAQEFLTASDFNDEAAKLDEFISFIRKTAQVGIILADRDLEENADEYGTPEAEEIASVPSAVNELDELFNTINA